MIRRLLVLTLPIAGLMLISTAASAKSIPLGPLSRSVLRDECLRSGGKLIGSINDETAPYGCVGRYAVVSCTPAADCQAVVRDTVPVVGNSLRSILNLGRSDSGVRAVQPVDARVNPAVTP